MKRILIIFILVMFLILPPIKAESFERRADATINLSASAAGGKLPEEPPQDHRNEERYKIIISPSAIGLVVIMIIIYLLYFIIPGEVPIRVPIKSPIKRITLIYLVWA